MPAKRAMPLDLCRQMVSRVRLPQLDAPAVRQLFYMTVKINDGYLASRNKAPLTVKPQLY